MSNPKKKILLFGKTGDGKSTVANMLGTGDVDGKFAAGNSLTAVTEQTKEFVSIDESSWTIIDTVGLFGSDKPQHDHKRIRTLRNYLAEKHGAIDLFCYVKKASKFTRADEQCWQAFHTLFANNGDQTNYHDNVLLVFTSCRQGWLEENKNPINDFFAFPNSAGVQRVPYDRSVGVDFPPHDGDPIIDDKYDVMRAESLKALKEKIGTASVQPLPLQILPDERSAAAHQPARYVAGPESEPTHHGVGSGVKGMKRFIMKAISHTDEPNRSGSDPRN